MRRHFIAAFVILAVLGGGVARAEDWPMWRHDAAHTSSTPEQLPKDLRLQWVLEQRGGAIRVQIPRGLVCQ